MTIKQLVEMCGNVNDKTAFLVYDSPEDYEAETSNWREYRKVDIEHCNAKISKFKVSKNFNYIAVALA